MARPSQALIDLTALVHNYRLAKGMAPDASTMAVIKANAYGHGAVAVARTLEPLAPAFGVACLEEGLLLREAGITKPLLLLDGFFSQEELVVAAENTLWLMIENRRQLQWLLSAKPGKPVTVWLKVDTGMHRLGAPLDQAASLYKTLRQSPNVAGDIVLATHFACADELENDFTRVQINRMKALATELRAPLSMANSPALLGWPQAVSDWNRPGYMLYGSSPFATSHPHADKLMPVMTFQSQVISLRTVPAGETVGYGATWRAEKTSLIATVPVGYGDGYPRNAPSGTPVMVNGQRARLAGRVSMDLISVDVTDIHGVAIGSAVELWGKNLPVNEVALAANTIGYELLTRMPSRLRRVYVGDGRLTSDV